MFKNFMFAAFALVLGATAANACTADGTHLCPGTGLVPSSTMTPMYDNLGHQIEGSYIMSPDTAGSTLGLVVRANGDVQSWSLSDLSCDPSAGSCAGVPWTLMWDKGTGSKGVTVLEMTSNGSFGAWTVQFTSAAWGAGTINKCSTHGGPNMVFSPNGVNWTLTCVDGTQVWQD